MKFITLIITILTIILVTCNVNAGINVKPLDVERIQQYYDKNQMYFPLQKLGLIGNLL